LAQATPPALHRDHDREVGRNIERSASAKAGIAASAKAGARR